MALLLDYQPRTSIPVELDGVTPDRLATQTVTEIERIAVPYGNRSVPLASLFSVTGDPSDGRIELTGDLSHVHRMGTGMNHGAMHIRGDAGRQVGGGMSGGEIHVDGHAGDWVGAEMSGGLIHVRGSAGHAVGSAYPGSRMGMTDGTILIDGDAGDDLGSKMRRGTIAVRGSCGASLGFGMIAGTILAFGRCEARAGAGMRRGTIGCFGLDLPELNPAFVPAGRFQPVFFRLIFAELARLGFSIDPTLLDHALTLYRGDLVVRGKGEIWMNLN